jgi:hypothetical protein
MESQPSPNFTVFLQTSLVEHFGASFSHTNLTMADLNLQEIHDFMVSIAKQAGERIVAAKPTTEGAGNKKNCEFLPS